MNYGLPYKGSKNAIAMDIANAIPKCGVILDACCGAFLHAACVSNRFGKVIGNDMNKAVVKLLDAVLINKGQNTTSLLCWGAHE